MPKTMQLTRPSACTTTSFTLVVAVKAKTVVLYLGISFSIHQVPGRIKKSIEVQTIYHMIFFKKKKYHTKLNRV